MDQYLKKMQDKCNLMHKFVKIEKAILKIDIILLFIQLYLLLFKNIFILKLIVVIPMFILAILSSIFALKARKLKEEILELSRELNKEFMKSKL